MATLFMKAANFSSAVALTAQSASSHGELSKIGTTDSLSQQDVGQRRVVFGSIIAAASALLLIGGVVVFLLRTRRSRQPRAEAATRGIAYTPLQDGAANEPKTELQAENADIQQVGAGLGGVSAEEMEASADPSGDGLSPAKKAEWMLRQAEKVRTEHAAYLRRRWWIIMVLFLAYVATTLGLPLLHEQEATCSRGFFWEVHMQFLAVFVLTKVVELCLCANDPTLEFGDMPVLEFLWKFCASFLGYVDAYTDATGVVIAHACPDSLAQTLSALMLAAYVVGVIFLQWMCMLGAAAADPSQACFLKLIHMDLLAHMITLPPEQKSVWDRLALVRTFGEDLPQAVLQFLYVVYVQRNPFMVVSIIMAVGSSLKALHDARARALATAAAEEAFKNRERNTEIYSCGQDGKICCWDVRTGLCKQVLEDQRQAVNVIHGARGMLYSAHDDGWIREWSLESGEVTRRFEQPGGGGRLCGNGDFIYSWGLGLKQPIREWSLDSGDCTRKFGEVSKIYAMSLGGCRLYTNGENANDVSEWSLEAEHESPPCVRNFSGHTGKVTAIRSTKKRLFTGAQDRTVREWLLETGESTRTFPDHGGLSFYPHSYILVENSFLYCPSASEPVIKVWDLSTGELHKVLRGHSRTVMGLTLLDGKLYSGSEDHDICEWDLNSGLVLRTFAGHTQQVYGLVVQYREAE